MEQVLTDDQSHYEISLTAGQAFVAFVLLLLSLAASFAFGLLIGRGQTDDHLVMRKDAAAITEAAAVPQKPAPVTKEVTTDDFKEPAAVPKPVVEATITPAAAPKPAPSVVAQPAPAGPVYAQLLSTSDQKTAEGLAAKLIGEGGFTAAYVERTTSDKGTIFRVRVKFASDAEARAAETKLKMFAKDVWITSK